LSDEVLAICLELGANDLHMVQLMPLPTIISYFIKILSDASYPSCPGKVAVKQVSV